MKHLLIKNLGPLKEANVDLGRMNLIIGKQSSGKSCVLRVACFCSWVEKKIEMDQSASYFQRGSTFKDILVAYHKMEGYFKKNTYIEYETKQMKFSYDNSSNLFTFGWKGGKLDYKRPKISYIPSERNVVSFIPEWSYRVPAYDCILDFMKDWDVARRYVKRTTNILNLGMRYQYNEATGEDKMYLLNGKDLLLSNSSSGVQSLVPLFVCLDYLTKGVYVVEAEPMQARTKVIRDQMDQLKLSLYDEILLRHENNDDKISDGYPVILDNTTYFLPTLKDAEVFNATVANFTQTQRTDLYIEEPEDNLFPPTQCQLMDWLTEMSKRRKHQVSIFITTHSPYILTHMLEQHLPGFKFFFTYQDPESDGYIVRTATEEEQQEIYDNGVDMFFNFETYIER